MREQVPVEKLAVGMFVAELDRPWLGTPFLIQGFVIESQREIEQFQRCCKHVFVERSQSLGDQFIADPVEKKIVPQRTRPEPQAHIYKDKQNTDGQTDDGFLGSIGKIFKSAFSSDGAAPEPERKQTQPARPREPVVTTKTGRRNGVRRPRPLRFAKKA